MISIEIIQILTQFQGKFTVDPFILTRISAVNRLNFNKLWCFSLAMFPWQRLLDNRSRNPETLREQILDIFKRADKKVLFLVNWDTNWFIPFNQNMLPHLTQVAF